MELMAKGLVVMVSTHSGLGKLLSKHEESMVVLPLVDSLIVQWQKLQKMSDQEFYQLGKTNRMHIMRMLDNKLIYQSYRALYKTSLDDMQK
jgi:hypothetical protein